MVGLHEINVKVFCAARISYATVKDCVTLLKKNNKGIDNTEAHAFCDLLLLQLSDLESRKCCSDCCHHIDSCNKSNCENAITCSNVPCENCGCENGKCDQNIIKKALCVLKELSEICKTQQYQHYQKFEMKSFIFQSFPYCSTWEKLWDQVNDANNILMKLLQRMLVISKDTAKDREMHMRVCLKMSKAQLINLYGEEAREIPNLEASFDTRTVPSVDLTVQKSCLSEVTLRKCWKFEELGYLVRKRDMAKLTDIFQINPKLVNTKVKENRQSKEEDEINLKHYKTLLKEAIYYCNSDVKDENGLPPIMTFLLSQKEIYCPIKYLYHGIFWSDRSGEVVGSAVKLLVKNDSMWIHQGNASGMTPLHTACKEADKKTVEFLLQQPTIVVNATNLKGYTPLHKAVKKLEIFQLLLTAPGIDINIKAGGRMGYTPLHLACALENKDIVELLMNRPDIDTLVYTPLNELPEDLADNDEIKRLILTHRKAGKSISNDKTTQAKADSDTSVKTKQSFPSLSKEELQRPWSFYDVWSLLMEKDFDNLERLFGFQPNLVNICNEMGRTLLHVLVIQGYPIRFIKFLIKHNASRCMRDVKGATVYSYAAMKRKEFMAALIESDCDGINISNDHWQTPFYMACKGSNCDVILLLLQTPNLKFDELDMDGDKAEDKFSYDLDSLIDLIAKYKVGGIAAEVKEYEDKMRQDQEAALKKKMRDFEGRHPEDEETRKGVAEKLQLTVTIKKKDGKLGCIFPDVPSGIFVKTVSPDGPAVSILQEGDQLLEVNGVNFRTITYAEAMKVLTSSEDLEMLIFRQIDEDGNPFLPW